MSKKALIFGITGQDGSYLTEFLLKKNYIVHGVKRRSSLINTKRIDRFYQEPYVKKRNFLLHYGDVTDFPSIIKLIKDIKPDEIYNLAAQSHVGVSFIIPEYTSNVDALGTLRILEAIRMLELKEVKFYQAGTSELYGGIKKYPQNEKTQFYPRSPYGVSKLYAHWMTINYRESYNIFACNGILFNHESPHRGETFVTKKIISGLHKIKTGIVEKIELGNLYAKRDWGHARDYVEAMWKILQHKKADDYVIATGKQYTVKDFVNLTAKQMNIKIIWKGSGMNEKGYSEKGKAIVVCNKKYFRPAEVDSLIGDASKARKILKWKPKINIHELIKEMIDFEKKSF